MESAVHRLWDELADFGAARVDDALNHLMCALCDMAQGTDVYWFGTLRLDSLASNDPVRGWRVGIIRNLRPSPKADTAVREQNDNVDAGAIDITILRNLESAGSFRANRLRDLADESWFQGDYYRNYYLAVGNSDSVYVAFPVSDDAESWFAIHRAPDQPPYTEAERDQLAYALRGLKWFHHQLLLSHGLQLVTSPLTGSERRVLHLLLTGLTEKGIANQLDRSPNTVHVIVTQIFRKFGVKNRASLMAMWLGSAGK